MRPTKEELKAALSGYTNGSPYLNDFDRDKLRTIMAAAEYLLKILPDLEDMIEARGEATQGEWYNGSHREDQATIKSKGGVRLREKNYRDCNDPTVLVLAANLIHSNEEKKNTALFITKAANAISRIAEVE